MQQSCYIYLQIQNRKKKKKKHFDKGSGLQK